MQNPYISLLKTAWKYARQERKRYVFVYFLFILANVVSSLNPILYGWFIDSIQRKGSEVLTNVWIYAAAYIGLQFLEWCFHGPARIMEREVAFNLSRNYLDEMYHQVLHLPVKWHQDHHSGSTINRLRKAYEALKNFFDNGFMYLHTLAKFVISFAAMVYFSPVYGSVGIVLGAITIWIIMQFDKHYIKSLEEVNEREHIVSSTLFDSLSNIITVITLRLEKRMSASLMSKVKDIFPFFRQNAVINEWKWFSASMLVALVYVVITLGYVHQNYVSGQTFYVGGLVILLGYINQFTSSFFDIAWQYTDIVKMNTDVQTAKNISEAYQEQHGSEAKENLPTNWQTIEIQNLNFSYNEFSLNEKYGQGLQDISLKIKRGEKIAFIGESGSGKSTLLALLRGLYLPENNVKTSVDSKKIDFGSLADSVTLFPQEPEIFENTIAYNITLGLPFADEEVTQVCETAQFVEVIGQLPNGLASNIQEKGVNLSGGQKQRLALARGILAARSSSIVLMDEPTSSVDPKTEMQIYDKLFEAFADKAIISSLHRLHLLTKFDYVYVLQNGRIVEEGTFENLRQNGKVFQELWKHQEEKLVGKLE
jgi:ATP-binding cassette, subfamily B, bacterial